MYLIYCGIDRMKNDKVIQELVLMLYFLNIFISLCLDFIQLAMAASFASRLSGLREKKINQNQNQEGQLKLTLLADPTQKSTYQPSTTSNNTRTSFRLLKGRIQKGQSTQKQEIPQNNLMSSSKGLSSTQKWTLPEQPKSELKLFLNDQPTFQEKKPLAEPPKIPIQKRILIAKQPPKEEPKKQQAPKKEQLKKEEVPPQPKIQKQASKQIIVSHEEKPIREEQAEDSLPGENENDLVMCPQGCGRKFNRKALEKHAKACKLVFMSKRKQFNSEAKRLVSKQQANIVKQNKLEQKKKMGATKGKGFEKTKTGENWKAASQDFRSAIKAIKQEEKDKNEEEDQGLEQVNLENIQEKKIVTVLCNYCQKKFNQIFIEKHLQNCTKKKEKEKEKKKTTKK